MEGRFSSYLRNQTAQTRRAEITLDAQRAAITSWAGYREPLREFVEDELSRRGPRPALHSAVAYCRSVGATLLIARFGDLARDFDFLRILAESGVAFQACDLPEATEAGVQVLLAVAEHDRKLRSERSRASLQEAKRRGVRLGNPNGLTEAALQRGRKLGTEARRNRADRFAHRVFSRVLKLQQQGFSLREVAGHLNAEGVPTARGRIGAWTAAGVRAVLLRVGSLD